MHSWFPQVSKRLLLQKVRRNAEEIEIAIGTVITFQEACVISLLFWAFLERRLDF